MARRAGAFWIVPPEQLADNCLVYGQRVDEATAEFAETLADWGEETAKRFAPWTDRTKQARETLHGEATHSNGRHTAWLSHGVWYGVFLELANGGKYAIVGPIVAEMAASWRVWARRMGFR